jgi:hypothetical protein
MESYSGNHGLYRGRCDGLAYLSRQPTQNKSRQEDACGLCFCIPIAVCEPSSFHVYWLLTRLEV